MLAEVKRLLCCKDQANILVSYISGRALEGSRITARDAGRFEVFGVSTLELLPALRERVPS